MAIMPHCVVCPWPTTVNVEGVVEFADYDPAWQPPHGPNGETIVGWSNELGVTAPPGVGLFCAAHLPEARQLSQLPAAEAVARLKAAAT